MSMTMAGSPTSGCGATGMASWRCSADDNGAEQFIDYRYDEQRRIYVITGIYDKIYLKPDEKTRVRHSAARRSKAGRPVGR